MATNVENVRRWRWRSTFGAIGVILVTVAAGWIVAGRLADDDEPRIATATTQPRSSAARDSQTRLYYESSATALSEPGLPGATLVRRWRFSTRLAPRWQPHFRARIQPSAGAVGVFTSRGKQAYQLSSPAVSLPAGSYEVALDGAVIDGGLQLGALDVRRDKWLATTLFWWGQRGFDRGEMTNPFLLSRPTVVQFVLTNWALRDSPSVWEIRTIELRQARA